MSQDAQSVVEADLSERLLSNPDYRIRQVALWYFSFESREAASLGGTGATADPHDRVLHLWHQIERDIALRKFDQSAWAAACQQTSNLLNSPASWQALRDLAEDIGDARLRPTDIEAAAESAAATWITDAVIAATALSQKRLTIARDEVLNASLPDSTFADVATRVLRWCSEEITNLLASRQSHLDELIARVEADASAGEELIRSAEQLATSLEPCVALIDGFDDDPETGEEGRVRDKAAWLIRSAAIAVYNHTSLEPRALALVTKAVDVAEMATTKTVLQRDAERLRFLIAAGDAVRALANGDMAATKQHLAKAGRHVANDEERDQLAELSSAYEQRVHVHSLEITPITGAPGLSTINGIGLMLYGSSDYDRITNSHCATHYFTALWIPVWPLARYRVRKENKTYQFLGRVPLRTGDIWHRWITAGVIAAGVLAIVIGSALGSFDSSSSAQTSPPPRSVPSAVPPRTSSGFSAPTLNGSNAGSSSAAATAAKAKLEAERARLDAQSTEVDRLSGNIDTIKRRLESAESQYPNGAPQAVVDQYESDRAQANAMVVEYNSKLAAYQSALAAFNAAVDDYNRRYVTP